MMAEAANSKDIGKESPDKVLRFTVGERFSHWVHAITFFLLLLTGFGIYSTFFHPAMVVFGGIQGARLIHRIMSVIFAVVVGAMFFIGDPRFHWEWLKSAFHFTKSDWQHITAFPREFFFGHAEYPAQDKFNGGEKINSLFTIFGSLFVGLSGLVMWFSYLFPVGLVRWAYPIHDLAMFMMLTAVIGHMYLALLHPVSRAAFWGMFNGYVSDKFAQAHHATWYERVKNQQRGM